MGVARFVLVLYLVNLAVCDVIFFPDRRHELRELHRKKRDEEVFMFPDDMNMESTVNEDRFDEGLYTEEEKMCFAMRKVWFKDACHSLVRDGPCEAGKWLVFDPDSSLLKAVCRDKPCRVGEVWWPNSGKCEVKAMIKSAECNGKFKDIFVDINGVGVCRCANGYGTEQDSDICYEFYQQGPCKENEVFTYDQTTAYGVCTKDRCYTENKPKRTSQKSKIKVPKTYAPLEGNGDCYKLGSSEPCTLVHEQSRFIIDTTFNVPRCSIPNKQLFVVDAPLLCRVGSDNRCQSPISISQQDRSSFINDIKNQLNKRKG